MFFLFVLLILLWTIKADIFFLLFVVVVFIYFILKMLAQDPIEILLSLGDFLLMNPLGFLLILAPLVIYYLNNFLKKISQFKKNSK